MNSMCQNQLALYPLPLFLSQPLLQKIITEQEKKKSNEEGEHKKSMKDNNKRSKMIMMHERDNIERICADSKNSRGSMKGRDSFKRNRDSERHSRLQSKIIDGDLIYCVYYLK